MNAHEILIAAKFAEASLLKIQPMDPESEKVRQEAIERLGKTIARAQAAGQFDLCDSLIELYRASRCTCGPTPQAPCPHCRVLLSLQDGTKV